MYTPTCITLEPCNLIALFVLVYLQVQCNVFEGASGEVALTAGGGLRELPGLTQTYENAALVCINKIVLRYDSDDTMFECK